MHDAATPPPLDELRQRREVWASKPQIRLVYERWLRMMRPFLPEGRVVEVGSGSGLLEDLLPEAFRCDIVPTPWVDLAADATRLPLGDASVDAVIGFDFLHHLADPHAFLEEAGRALRPGGRVLLLEPWITPVSYLGYRLLHHENLTFRDYQTERGNAAKTDPWQGNLALANLVFKRDRKNWRSLHSDLHLVHRRLLSFCDFQLAAGFKPHALLPHPLFRAAVRLDSLVRPLMPLIAFRIFVVLEKR